MLLGVPPTNSGQVFVAFLERGRPARGLVFRALAKLQ
jgi:hypothetical protein